MKNIEQQLADFKAELQKEVESKIKAFEASLVKPQFEVGKWYMHDHDVKCLFNYQPNGKGFGFYNDGWTVNRSCDPSDWNKIVRPATKEEIQEALTKEAIKRGFKEGAYFKCLEKGIIRPYKPYSKADWDKGDSVLRLEYYENGDHLFCSDGLYNVDLDCCSNPSIYREGKWATIISEPKIIICDMMFQLRLLMQYLKN